MFRSSQSIASRSRAALVLVAIVCLSIQVSEAQQPAPPAAPPASPAPAAQQPAGYSVVPILPELQGDTVDAKRALQQYQSNFRGVFTGVNPINDPAVKDKLDKYCKFYYFARLTHPENLGDWAKERQNFFKQLANTKLTPVHDYFINLTFTVMKVIATGNYHPVARYNAMMFMANLNEIEARLIGDQKRQPKPYLPALTFMWDEYEKPTTPDAVKLACLVGIMRHARVDRQMSAGRILVGTRGGQRLTDLMVKTIDQKDPPNGRSQDGNDWFRRRAMEILGTVGAVGDNEIVVSTLRKALQDNENSIRVRCTAAEALGNLAYPANVTIKPAEVAKEMGAVAVVVSRTESLRLQDVVEKEAQESMQGMESYGGYGGYGGYGEEEYGGYGEEEYGGYGEEEYGGYGEEDYGGYGEEYGGYGEMGTTKPFDPAGYRIIQSRRNLKWPLVMIRKGLGSPAVPAQSGPGNTSTPPKPATGMLALAKTPADKAAVQAVIDNVDGIVAVTDDYNHEDLGTLAGEIVNKVVELEDKCGIVVDMPGVEDDTLAQPEDLLGGSLGDAMDALGGGLDTLQGPGGAPAAPAPAGNGGPAAPAPAPAKGGPAPAPPANGGPAPAPPANGGPAPAPPANGGPAPAPPANGGPAPAPAGNAAAPAPGQ